MMFRHAYAKWARTVVESKTVLRLVGYFFESLRPRHQAKLAQALSLSALTGVVLGLKNPKPIYQTQRDAFGPDQNFSNLVLFVVLGTLTNQLEDVLDCIRARLLTTVDHLDLLSRLSEKTVGLLYFLGEYEAREDLELRTKSVLDAALGRQPGLYRESAYFSAIGHIALLDYLFKGILLNKIDSSNVELIKGKFQLGNAAYARLWAERAKRIGLTVAIASPKVADRDEPDLELFPSTGGGYDFARHKYGEIERQWAREGGQPLIEAEAESIQRGLECLTAAGLDPEVWFVGFHIRNGGDVHRSLRDDDLNKYRGTFELVRELGGQSVLLGPPVATVSKSISELVIDARYQRGTNKEHVNIYCWSQARSFVGNMSGGTHPPGTFGVRTLWTSLFPLGVFRPPSQNDFFLPKLVKIKGNHKVLTLKQMLSREHARSRVESKMILERFGYQIRELTEKELTMAMEDFLESPEFADGAGERHPLDARVDKEFSAFHQGIGARISPSFLDKWGGELFGF